MTSCKHSFKGEKTYNRVISVIGPKFIITCFNGGENSGIIIYTTKISTGVFFFKNFYYLCIMINKYKTQDYEFIMYGEDIPEAPEHIELIEENVKLEDNQTVPIFEFDKQQRDKKLFNEGIMSYEDLKYAYFLIKTKELKKSKKIRDYVLEKYESLSEYFSE